MRGDAGCGASLDEQVEDPDETCLQPLQDSKLSGAETRAELEREKERRAETESRAEERITSLQSDLAQSSSRLEEVTAQLSRVQAGLTEAEASRDENLSKVLELEAGDNELPNMSKGFAASGDNAVEAFSDIGDCERTAFVSTE